ncbi:MAG: diacylglycerol kinase family lipid kinase [Bacteroidales bacterium]|nr:diacylglycerol kinase family lipid kinase [Bacteroidales bacterium]
MFKIRFVVNPHSGIGKYRDIEHLLSIHLDKSKFDYDVVYTQKRGHATEITKDAVTKHFDVVVAVGGDGTIREVAGGLVKTDTAMGIIPVGSGNGLARHIGIPIKLSKAVHVINQMHEELIDTVDVNNNVSVSMAGIGFDALIAKKFDNSSQRGFFPYFRFTVGSFFWYKSHTVIVETPEQTIKCKNTLLVNVANSSQWGFNVKIAPKASLQDGLLDICVVKKPSLFLLPTRIFLLLIGKLHQDKLAVHVCKTSQCRIYEQNEDWQYCHLDGDPIGRQKMIQIALNPKSLKVITPINI